MLKFTFISWVVLSVVACSSKTNNEPLQGDAQVLSDSSWTSRVNPTTCLLTGESSEEIHVTLSQVLSGSIVQKPVQMIPVSSATKPIFIVSQPGRIFTADQISSAGTVREWFNIESKVYSTELETGLLGLAFDPDFSKNGAFYVNYTQMQATQLQTVVSRFFVKNNVPDITSEQVLLKVNQPYSNHNGGQLAFGHDGYLYVGMGDGGSAGDPQNRAQNLNELLGKILRIDVRTTDATYLIPQDNPFVNQVSVREEIWAYGLRNPWRFSFDSVTGALWAGDVGQGAYEEIDVIEKGKNYGWRIVEGNQCYNPATNCNKLNLTPPIYEYPHSDGLAVTGGFVYRGKAIPSLYGTYVFGDYSSGMIWGLSKNNNQWKRTLLIDSKKKISAFGIDGEGELYVLDHTAGTFFRIEQTKGTSNTNTPIVPRRLSETGCFRDLKTRAFAEGILSFSVNTPLWSDGTDKERGLVLPANTKIQYKDTGTWGLPVGTVLIKTFLINKQPIETRFLMHRQQEWQGITYRWNSDRTEAYLLTDSLTESIDGQTWYYPSRADCLVCHTQAAGNVLGVQTAQLNRTHDILGNGHMFNQIESLRWLGYFEQDPTLRTEELPRFAAIDDSNASLTTRARSYLHSNCSHCHRPNGVTTTTLDLRYETLFTQTQTCQKPPTRGDLGLTNPQIIKPGMPEESILYLRALSRDPRLQMPSLATTRVDNLAIGVVYNWIAQLKTGCSDLN